MNLCFVNILIVGDQMKIFSPNDNDASGNILQICHVLLNVQERRFV